MVSGKDIADALFEDLENLFFSSAHFRIKREFNQNTAKHITYVGAGNNARIRISKDFCDFEAEGLSDLFFIMISLSHECAHYLNKHNEHIDTDEYDIKAIESWADYFGARIFATIITFGKKSQRFMTDLHNRWDQKVVINAIGKAIREVHDKFYNINTDERYPAPIERVSIFNAGFTSFFYRVYGEVKKDFTLWILLTIIKVSELGHLYENYETDWEDQNLISTRLNEIHRKIQGYEPVMTPGLKTQFLILLVTNYQLSPPEIRLAKSHLERQMEKMGI